MRRLTSSAEIDKRVRTGLGGPGDVDGLEFRRADQKEQRTSTD